MVTKERSAEIGKRSFASIMNSTASHFKYTSLATRGTTRVARISNFLTDKVFNLSVIQGEKGMRQQHLCHLWMIFLLILVGVLGMSGAAFAKDAVVAAVTPLSGPTPIVTEHGTGYTSGTYAIGTIVLNYTVTGFKFPVGNLATFDLGLSVYDAGGSKEPAYPVTLAFDDLGSEHVTLSPASPTISVQNLNWSGSVIFTVSVPEEVAEDSTLNSDGRTLVGNLRLCTPGEKNLDTVTNVQVKITLVYPTACLRVYNYITDTSLLNTFTSVQVGVSPKGKLSGPQSLSDNVLIANTCGTNQTFDLGVLLDPAFSTQPSNNPGNAVFTFSTTGELDPDTLDYASLGDGAKQGQNLCLQNITILPGDTFLATVHFGLVKDADTSVLPGGGMGPGTFTGFGAALTEPNTSCKGGYFPADQNPITLSLPFTLK